MMAGDPWFKWYPADWRADPGLLLCSLAARGLWIELLGIMHEASPPGYLLINGHQPSVKQVADVARIHVNTARSCLSELDHNGVFSRLPDGTIFSRKMVRDIEKSKEMTERGRLGGSPLLKSEVKQAHMGVGLHHKPEARSQKPDKAKTVVQELGAEAPPPKKKPARLPDDWEMPPAWRLWALGERPEWDTEDALRASLRFRDYYLGSGRPMLDWYATWRNWVRREDAKPKGRPPAGGLSVAGQQTAAAIDRWIGKTGTDDGGRS